MVKKFGTREEVCDGKATMTKGGLTAEDMNVVTNKKGERRFVSKKASDLSKARNFNRPQIAPVEEYQEPVHEPAVEVVVKGGSKAEAKVKKSVEVKLQPVNTKSQPISVTEPKRRGRPSKAEPVESKPISHDRVKQQNTPKKFVSPSILDECSQSENSDEDDGNMSRVYPPAETKKRVKKAVIASAKQIEQLAA